MLNHKAYADRHGYRYRFDISPRADQNNPYYHKLDAILDALPDTDWLFWIDDDAAFTQLDRPFAAFVPEMEDPNVFAIFCASPVNPAGGWTTISSGNFLIRNSYAARAFIEAARKTDLEMVKAWWDQEALGMFTGGDQDALVYQVKTDPLSAAGVCVLEYERFNTRPYHFTFPEQHFLVHFTHRPETTKAAQMEGFAKTYGLDELLLPAAETARYSAYAELHRRR